MNRFDCTVCDGKGYFTCTGNVELSCENSTINHFHTCDCPDEKESQVDSTTTTQTP